MSASFALKRPWKEALKLVHAHNWEKWELLHKEKKATLPTKTIQAPGVIADSIFEELQEVISKLPEPKKYPRIA